MLLLADNGRSQKKKGKALVEALVDKDYRDAVFKQRRLLLILTFLLAAIQGADVTLGPSAQAVGLILEIGKPRVIVTALWVGWVYALYRYWLYYRALPHAAIATVRERLLVKHAAKLSEPGFAKLLRRNVQRGVGLPDLVHIRVVAQNDSRLILDKTTGGGAVTRAYAQSYDPATGDPVGPSVDVAPSVSPKMVKRAKRHARAEFFAAHPYATDFVAPFWIAMLAPLAGAIDLYHYLMYG